MFMHLLKRYLGEAPDVSGRGHIFESHRGEVELLAFCLMPNHFHLYFYLDHNDHAITELIRKVAGTYTVYFNKKYKRVGHLFQGIYKAKQVDNDAYLHHISRYIHLNPRDYKGWAYSSYKYYAGELRADWLRPDKVLALFRDAGEYRNFVDDYEGYRDMLSELKQQLADL